LKDSQLVGSGFYLLPLWWHCVRYFIFSSAASTDAY